MGAYINPPGETKEEFLAREGTPIPIEQAALHIDFTNNMVVVRIDNGAFSACAIAFSLAELAVLVDPMDRRKRTCFVVPRAKLLPVSNLDCYLSGGNQ